jgi:hypothetical protein
MELGIFPNRWFGTRKIKENKHKARIGFVLGENE